ncbi:Fic/DOC family protein [Streptomyces tailanensis]|uniref:Fic/DOC family protein n=1 Tax=Streptomyces tailanensis TaxID=2569858 RepID=UPI002482DEC3|nr:Fic family protein [Streptomyces tailanensis]
MYHWAGELRTVDIAKHTPFCPLQHMTAYAAEVFGRLRAADHLRGLARDDFVRAAAGLYGDTNALHPFREGNGRTQRAFLTELGRQAGWPINWAGLDADENEHASIKSFLGDNQPLERMLDRLVSQELR